MHEHEPTYDYARFKRLTPRELEVAFYLADPTKSDSSVKTIASGLNMSISTVDTHLIKIRDKLGFRKNVQVAVITLFYVWREAVVRAEKSNINPFFRSL